MIYNSAPFACSAFLFRMAPPAAVFVYQNLIQMIEYISQHLWLVWTIVAMLCLIIELGSGDFFVTCFAIGALGAMVSSLFDVPLWLQVIIFAVCSVVSLVFVRPPLVHALHASGENRVSNAEALIGQTGTVEEPITGDQSGYVKIDGDVWKAVSTDLETIQRGERVRVVRMDSIILTVERCL